MDDKCLCPGITISTDQLQWKGQKERFFIKHAAVFNRPCTGDTGHEPRRSLLVKVSLIARFMGPTWGPSGADRTQVGPMLAPSTLLSGMISEGNRCCKCLSLIHNCEKGVPISTGIDVSILTWFRLKLCHITIVKVSISIQDMIWLPNHLCNSMSLYP